MKTSKRLLALLVLTLLLSNLAPAAAAADVDTELHPADTQPGPAEAAGTGSGSDENTVITLWTYPIGSWGNDTVVRELVDRFETACPGITVEVSYLDYMTGSSLVEEAIANGTAPDLILEGPELLAANYGARGLMADLSDLLDETDLSEIYPNALAAGYGADGGLYLYPMAGTVHCMAINRTVFEAAGAMQYLDEETRTWNSTADFFEAVQTVYDYTGNAVGAVCCGGQGGDQATRVLVTNLYGGTFTDAAHTRYTWNSQPIIDALQALYDCNGMTFESGLVGGDEIALFCHEQLNMAFCWNIAQQQNPNMADTGAGRTVSGDEIMFMAFPSDSTPQLQGGIWGFGVFDNGDAARIDAAKRFVKYMCDSAATADAVRATGYFALRDTAEGTDLSDIWAGDDIMSEYAGLMPLLGDYYQVTPNWREARTCWWQMLQEVANGRDIASAVKDWTNSANGGAVKELSVMVPMYSNLSADWWAQFEQDFEAAHQDVDLIVDCLSWNDIYGELDQRLRQGNAPDILSIDDYASFQADGLLMPVDAYISPDTCGKFYPAFLEQSRKDGSIWAVPDLASARGMYYNADILASVGADVPATWEELENVCALILKHYGGDVYPWGIDMTTNEGQAAFALYTWANGGGFTDDGGNWLLNSDENVEAIEYAARLYQNGFTTPDDHTRYDIQDLFAQGRVAMMITSDNFSTWVDGVNYGVAPLPANAGKAAASLGVMDRFMCFDNGYSPAELEAITAFFDFFYEDTRYAAWTRMEGFLPATSSGMEQMIAEDPARAPWAEILDSCRFYPSDQPCWGDVRMGVIDVLQNALLGADVRELLDDLQARVTDGSGGGDEHAPFLSFRWLTYNDGWEQAYDWMYDGWDWSNGYIGSINMIPGDEFWQVYYLNTWNEETQSYDAVPVHVDMSGQLSWELVCDTDEPISASAEDAGYYYRTTVLEDTWDQTGVISYTMADGTVVSLDVMICRGEAEFYSGPVISNETYIRSFCYSRINTNDNVFYFGFQSDYWTLDYVEPILSYMDVPGYELSEVLTLERISSDMYRITLSPEVSSIGCGVELCLNLFVSDPEGNSNNGDWCQYIWCYSDGQMDQFEANIGINDQNYQIYRTADGQTAAYADIYFEDGSGDGYWRFMQVDLPDGVSYDLDTNTLTLNNASLTNLNLGYASFDESTGQGWYDLPNADLTIELLGENTIFCDYNNALCLSNGLHATITGSGSLYVCSENTAPTDDNGNYYSYNTINMYGDAHLTIAGNARVTAEIAGQGMESCWEGETYLGARPAQVHAIHGGQGTLTLKDNASLTTIVPEGSRVNGPKLEDESLVFWDDWYPGGYRGISGMSVITIEGGTLDTQEIDLGWYWSEDGFLRYGSFIQSGGTANITSRGSYGETEQWIWDEEVQDTVFVGYVDHYHYDGLGNHEGGYLEVSGGTLNITCAPTEEEIASSAYANALYLGYEGQAVITGGTVNVEATHGRAVTVNDLQVSGGILNAFSGDSCGIEANTFAISGGTVNVRGKYEFILWSHDLSISGGALMLHTDDGFGLSADNLTISDGRLDVTTAFGLNTAVWENFSVSGGEVNLNSAYGDALNLDYADTVITGGTVTISGTESNLLSVGDWEIREDDPDAQSGSLTMSGGSLILNACGEDYFGMVIRPAGVVSITGDSQMTLNNGRLQIEGSLMTGENAALTLNESVFTINTSGFMSIDGGSVSVTDTWDSVYNDEWPTAVWLDRGAELIVNDGSLTMDLQEYRVGLAVNGSYTQNGGEVTINTVYSDAGYFWYEDIGYQEFRNAFAMTGKGYTTINGGILNLNGVSGYEQAFDAGDPENPDWPANRNTRLTINGGSININAEYAGFDLSAPVVINGGNIRVNTAGIHNPRFDCWYGYGLWIWDNGCHDADVATAVEINGGRLDLTCAAPDGRYGTAGIATTFPHISINGGIIRTEAAVALWGIGDEPTISLADTLDIRSLTSGNSKALLQRIVEESYTDPDGFPVTNRYWYTSVEEDNIPGDPFGEALDECTGLLICDSTCGDDLTWDFGSGVLTISGSGRMDSYTADVPAPWYALRDLIRSVTVEENVTAIGSHAFSGCTALEQITFLGSAPTIGANAFKGVTATARYYANTTGWTSSVKRSYGGVITWDDIAVIASGWSGYTTWVLTEDGVMTVSGEGNMKNYNYKSEMPWYAHADKITSVVIREGVTAIGSYAFYAMPNLARIRIADTVTNIGNYAFKGCEKLDNVVLPAGLSKLGESAFYGCTALSAIEIPASLWTIQPYTFKNCTALAEVRFNEGNLMKISDGAFYGTAVTEVTFPNCLDILDVYAFKGCANLTSITLGSGLTELREAVFYGTAIPAITIPEGITKIGPYVFKNCVALETIDLPESLKSVGEASFYACTGLKSVELPDAVTSIGNYAFRKCSGLTSVEFGSSLVTIGECSFYGCTGLTELVIPDEVTAIKPYAFKTCTSLTSVTLGSSVKTIGEGAFNTCTGLKTIIFPASLTSIGSYCFSGSWNLWKLTFRGNAPAIGTGAFKGMAATAYYPSGNSTWTASVRLNYGGKITWIAQ